MTQRFCKSILLTSLRRLLRINQCMYLSHSNIKSTFSLQYFIKRLLAWTFCFNFYCRNIPLNSVLRFVYAVIKMCYWKRSSKKLKYVIVWKINALCTLTCRWAWFSYRLSSSWVNPRSLYPIHYPTLSPGLCTLLLCNYLVTHKHDPVY